jgi:hypothetical protein
MITKQPYLRCCANCKHFNPGWDDWHGCLFDYTPGKGGEVDVNATDICEKYDQQEGEVR